MKMVTEEFVVLEKSEKDVKCSDGNTRHYYNVKVGSKDYENITLSVTSDMFGQIDKDDNVIFLGSFGGLKNQFWKVTGIYQLNGKVVK